MSVIYMLDTNASSAAIRGDAGLDAKLQTLDRRDWCISTITVAEHLYGLAKKPEAVRLAELVHAFLDAANVLTWDMAAAGALGQIRADLEKRGQVISAYDMLIAAHALSRNLILVTDNVREFTRVENLKVENWQRATKI